MESEVADALKLQMLSAAPAGEKTRFLSKNILQQIETANKELWLILSMIVIVALMNYVVTAHSIILGLYVLPTIFSAYYYGRRHATLTAFASIFTIVLAGYLNPDLLKSKPDESILLSQWYEILSWGSVLVVTAYTMGTLYERNQEKIAELRQTYRGLIIILRQFISKDKYTENHCYRVSVYAAKIAAYMRMTSTQIEDIRSAALLHDLGKIDISRNILYKAAQLTREEFEGIKKHVDKGAEMLSIANTPLNRIIPIILAHHERTDGSGYFGTRGEDIPIEARVIAVADVYDALASDRPYRKALSPLEVKEQILKGAGKEFDTSVVDAFIKAFQRGDMEIPNIVL